MNSPRHQHPQPRPRSPFYLPLPASSSNLQDAAHPALSTFLAPLFVRKTRFSVLICTAIVSFALYYLLLSSGSSESRWTFLPPSLSGIEKGTLVGDVRYVAFDKGASSANSELDNLLPIREDPHPNPHIPLPEETVFDNPWPENDKIVNVWLSDDRLAGVPFEPPDWSTLSSKGVGKEPNRLAKDEMVKWEEFWRPRGYKPAKLVADPKSSSYPKIQKQGSFGETAQDIKVRRARRDWAKRAFLHAWTGYKTKAWGHDEVLPVSGRSSDPFNAWGATIVDSLSTLLVMNLTEEYSLARTHVRQIDFTTVLGERSAYGAKEENGLTVPVFETIIRYLGGLLSAYDLTDGKDLLMLERAEELAGWLMGAFDTRYGLPVGKYSLSSHLKGKYAGHSVLAEVSSFSLEFGRLAQITGKMEYYDVVHRAGEYLGSHSWKGQLKDASKALLPTYVDDSEGLVEGTFGFGAQTDSYYEYLLKSSLLFRNTTISPTYLFRYFSTLDSAYAAGIVSPVKVVPGADNTDLTIFGQLKFGTYWPVLEHLACFTGGLVAMGSRVLPGRQRDLEAGELFTKTCFWAYNATYTGLGPETMSFYHPLDTRRFSKHTDPATSEEFLKVAGSPAGQQKADRKYQGRPETIESVYYLWRITGNKEWQERGWAMFTAWVKHTVVPFGFSGINNVNSKSYRHVDAMESFVLAETLKYYYLLFSDPDFLSLDEFVFNTEAHPLRLPTASSSGLASSFTSPWSYSELDDKLQEEYSDPREADSSIVGMGTWVQQTLCRFKS